MNIVKPATGKTSPPPKRVLNTWEEPTLGRIVTLHKDLEEPGYDNLLFQQFSGTHAVLRGGGGGGGGRGSSEPPEPPQPTGLNHKCDHEPMDKVSSLLFIE